MNVLACMYNEYIIHIVIVKTYAILLCIYVQIYYYNVIYYNTNVYLGNIKTDYYLFRNVYTVFLYYI